MIKNSLLEFFFFNKAPFGNAQVSVKYSDVKYNDNNLSGPTCMLVYAYVRVVLDSCMITDRLFFYFRMCSWYETKRNTFIPVKKHRRINNTRAYGTSVEGLKT